MKEKLSLFVLIAVSSVFGIYAINLLPVTNKAYAAADLNKPVLDDTFSRTLTSGWGTSDDGAEWKYSSYNSDKDASVGDGYGSLKVYNSITTLNIPLKQARNVKLEAPFIIDKLPARLTGADQNVTLRFSFNEGNFGRDFNLTLFPQGVAEIALIDGDTTICKKTSFGFKAATQYNLTLEYTGTGPTFWKYIIREGSTAFLECSGYDNNLTFADAGVLEVTTLIKRTDSVYPTFGPDMAMVLAFDSIKVTKTGTTVTPVSSVQPTVAPSGCALIPEDINKDCSIDLLDFELFRSAYIAFRRKPVETPVPLVSPK